MSVAVDILSEFSDRIEQVHLSEVNGKGKHFAISFGAELAYAPFVEIMASVPVIIEAMVGESEVEAEVEKAWRLLRRETRVNSKLIYADVFTPRLEIELQRVLIA